MLIAEMQPFKGMENYFMDQYYIKTSLKLLGKLATENYYNGNEVDSKLELVREDDFMYEINPFVINIDKLDVIDDVDEAGEWIINKNLGFTYLPTIASNFEPSFYYRGR